MKSRCPWWMGWVVIGLCVGQIFASQGPSGLPKDVVSPTSKPPVRKVGEELGFMWRVESQRLIVDGVKPFSAAEKAGFEPGDVIRVVDRDKYWITSLEQFDAVMALYPAGALADVGAETKKKAALIKVRRPYLERRWVEIPKNIYQGRTSPALSENEIRKVIALYVEKMHAGVQLKNVTALQFSPPHPGHDLSEWWVTIQSPDYEPGKYTWEGGGMADNPPRLRMLAPGKGRSLNLRFEGKMGEILSDEKTPEGGPAPAFP